MITLPQSYSHTLVYVHTSFIPLLLSSCLHSHNHTLTHIITTSLLYHNPTQIYTFIIYILSLIYIHMDTFLLIHTLTLTEIHNLTHTLQALSVIKHLTFTNLHTHTHSYTNHYSHKQTPTKTYTVPSLKNTPSHTYTVHTLSQILSLQSPLLNNFQNIRSNCYLLK